MTDHPNPTILIFDSGMGGISVYQQIQKSLPNCNYLYVFDNQGYPYGELSRHTLIKRVENLLSYVIKQHSIDMVVIACNTASTVVLPTLREKFEIPIVGVVPAIKPAANLAKTAIGLLATPATVEREYTHQLIAQFSQNIPVTLIGSTELVDMAEMKLRGHSVNIHLLTQILSPLKNSVDVVVLGCTHFPLIKEEISQVLGESTKLVDSGDAIARRVVTLISSSTEIENREKSKIYSSATPFEEAALNLTLSKLGFDIIETLPILDA